MKRYPKAKEVNLHRISDNKQSRIVGYSDVVKDHDGWVDAALFLPMRFDLVIINDGIKSMSGWWTGIEWSGYKYKGTEIKAWKKGRFEHEES